MLYCNTHVIIYMRQEPKQLLAFSIADSHTFPLFTKNIRLSMVECRIIRSF